MVSRDLVIETKGLRKSFPGVLANDQIDIDIRRGEVHAIVGENGAGKSTLMKILCGLYQPDAGEIFLNGEKIELSDPGKAIKLGIGMVHQHFMLIPRFSVTENIILGAENSNHGVLNFKKAHAEVEELCKRYEFDLNPKELVADLSVGEQQRVEILKVLYRGAEVIIMDEPTAVLVPQEVDELFKNLKLLVEAGKTVIFISHKLDEVLEISDRITVLRRGQKAGTVSKEDTNKKHLAEMMVGRPVLFTVEKGEADVEGTVLEINNLHYSENGQAILNGVNFEVKAGEIYGIAGVEGNGQTELVETIVGLRKPANGSVKLLGKDITGKEVVDIRKEGIGFVPEDRHKRGLVLPMTVAENSILGKHNSKDLKKSLLLDYKKIEALTKQYIADYDIRVSSPQVEIGNLSGGNQQKVILAREFSGEPNLIIAAQPTRGLDVGAIEFVRKELVKARDAGKAVLLISADLEEVMAMSDRIGVIYNGRITSEFLPEEVDHQQLGHYMLGSEKEGAAK